MSEEIDEEGLAAHHAADARRSLGAFFTPASVAARLVALAARWVPSGRLRVIDPACGAGALLTAAKARWPHAELIGLEVDPVAAATCRERLPGATIHVGNALLEPRLAPADGAFELWLGNPPWNGTSTLLKDAAAWARVRTWLPETFALKPRTSLREDYVFFLLLAARRLAGASGAIAFITSSSLLDAWAHAPIRGFLCDALSLVEREVLDRGTFANTRVEPCITVWTTARTEAIRAQGDELNLRPLAPSAVALDAKWRAEGATISELVPVSFAGLKTRFDELLVDDDRERLEARVRAFLSEQPLPDFARAFGLEGFEKKLEALPRGGRFEAGNVRRFLRYRGPLPMKPPGWCYVARELIPRGDHRLRGAFDPHLDPLKLVFNRLESPLAAHLIDSPGCVTMYRHSRFAPSRVPPALLADPDARPTRVPTLVPNLTPLGARFGSPREVFGRIAAHVQSEAFQAGWAPAFATTREAVVPFSALAQT